MHSRDIEKDPLKSGGDTPETRDSVTSTGVVCFKSLKKLGEFSSPNLGLVSLEIDSSITVV